MYVYSAAQIRQWDAYTIAHEPIASIQLMERAAQAVADWLMDHYHSSQAFDIWCGRGNNGGDGLAVARILFNAGYSVRVVMVQEGNASTDYLQNKAAIDELGIDQFVLPPNVEMPVVNAGAVIVEALFGTGINRAIDGWYARVIAFLNQQPNRVVSIDMPAGLPAMSMPFSDAVIRADSTLTFQCPKLALLVPECEPFFGNWHLLDIGLHQKFLDENPGNNCWVQHPADWVAIKQFGKFAHKGTRGHAMLGVGSHAMMGAAVLATAAALRSGAGLVTTATDAGSWPVIHTALPEAMCAARNALVNDDFLRQRKIKALGVGPGWVADDEHLQMLAYLIQQNELSLVIDATALNLLAQMKTLLAAPAIERQWVLTPHVGEFDRLFGSSSNHFERIEKAMQMAQKTQAVIVLKGAYSKVITPTGKMYVNTTGNPGMAKGGSGDVLTGIITGLLAQNYDATEAAVLGCWLHGTAGDFAAANKSVAAMNAMDIVEAIPQAWQQLAAQKTTKAF